MRHVLALFLLCLASTFAYAEGFATASLVCEGEKLLITTSDGGQFEAPALPDQVGFDSPEISPDGRYVGWLALFPNCCTSYPIPGKLVVLGKDRKLRTFDGLNLGIFRSSDGASCRTPPPWRTCKLSCTARISNTSSSARLQMIASSARTTILTKMPRMKALASTLRRGFAAFPIS
jgi:hypothetical protein